MAGSKLLYDALRLQFQWIPALITDRGHCTPSARKRAMLFALLHIAFVVVICSHFASVIASWVLAFVLQAGAMGLALMHLALFEDYADNMSNALELEPTINALIVAEISVRTFALLQCAMTHSWFLFLFEFLEIAYDLYVVQHRSLLIDATTIWKEVRTFRIDGRIRLGYQMSLVFISVAYLVVSLYES